MEEITSDDSYRCTHPPERLKAEWYCRARHSNCRVRECPEGFMLLRCSVCNEYPEKYNG